MAKKWMHGEAAAREITARAALWALVDRPVNATGE
jgi:hypothetical protein